MPTRALVRTAALALPLALALGACSSSSQTSGPPITVKASDTTCELSSTSASAGTVEFTITNSGTKVTEFYVYKDDKSVAGELENISPGLTRSVKIDLSDAGTYETACKPGMEGDGIRAPFTVK